ncbi:MAG: sigma-54-dependent Fis family transcriptional regulator [Bacteroidetes bacterium]|nr:MAG: sigma-54-dependent Fis family transcriptional regulator [Bacteroidota bacterium]
MFTDFRTLAETLPCGLIIADKAMNIEFINDFARSKILALPQDYQPSNLNDYTFFTTDMRRFDMDSCMRSMVEAGKRTFHKTLLVKSGKQEKLVYFSVNTFVQKGKKDLFLFNITDISDEMDCITHSPGTFGKGEYMIRNKIIGNDQKMQEIYRMISLAADSEVNVLVQGESGTGKELVADAIHGLSDRKNGPLVKVNCSAFSETLLESELFGHVKGSFTGAYKDKPGKFEMANGGTIFLDEIGEINQSIQVKLLRVIQEKTIERVGDNKSVKVDMRIVAATNKNLRELIKKDIFREDLFYRLNVFNIFMPSLRERHLDIPLLVDYFIEKFNTQTGKKVKGVNRDSLKLMMEYPWPGNIRELQNAIEHAFVLVNGNIIEMGDLPLELQSYSPARREPVTQSGEQNLSASVYYAESFKNKQSGRLKINREQLMGVLEMHDFNQTKTAEFLGISRVALWKKIKKFEI